MQTTELNIAHGFATVGEYESTLNQAQRAIDTAAKSSAKSLPKFFERDTGLSPTLLRSALFGSAERGTRGVFTRQAPAVLASANGDKITFIGEELRQDDESVLLAFVKMAAGRATFGAKLTFTPRAFSRGPLGWTDSGVNVPKLKACIQRLKEAYILIKYADGTESTISFVANYTVRLAGEEWTVILDEQLADVFAKKVTFLRVEDRLQLKEGMQTWLFGFINADSCAERLKLEDMKMWAGSKAVQKEFNRALRAALEALEKGGMIESFDMGRTTLKINRN